MKQGLRIPLDTIRARFNRFFNPLLRFSDEDTKVVARVPGLNVWDYTRAGTPAIWNVLRIPEIFRYFDHKTSTGGEHATQILNAQKNVIHPNFYKLSGTQCPMTITQSLGRMGKRSITMIFTLCDEKSGVVLMEAEKQVLMFDRDLGKTVPLTDQTIANMSKYGSGVKEPFKIPLSAKPNTFYVYKAKIHHSDSDVLYHTNQSVYVRLCIDCAVSAQYEGKLEKYPYDILAMDVAEVDALYKAETFMGDEVEVHMWEDEDSENVLNFEVCTTARFVASFTIKFYPPELTSKL